MANVFDYIFNIGGNFSAQISGMSAAAGNFTASVEGADSGVRRFTGSLATFSYLKDVFQNVADGFSQLSGAGIKLDSQMHDLSAVAGVAGEGLKQIEGFARQSAKAFGTDAAVAVEGYKLLLSQLSPELGKYPEALSAMGDCIQTTSKLMRGDGVAAAEVLTTAMNQYGVSLEDPTAASEEMARMMNAMAAAGQAGSAELPAISAALQQCGMAAKAANVSFEETNAAIQVLDKAGKKASEGGVALRNVLGQLSKGRFIEKAAREELEAAGIDVIALGDNSKSLQERLEMLKPLLNDSALLSKFFGVENANAARALIQGTDQLQGFTEAVTGTNSATEQAAIVMDSYAERQARVNQQFEDLKISIFQATGDFSLWCGVLTSALVPFAQLAPLLTAVWKFMLLIKGLNWAGMWAGVVGWARSAVMSFALMNGTLTTTNMISLGFIGNIGRATIGLIRFATVGILNALKGIGALVLSFITGGTASAAFSATASTSFGIFATTASAACRAVSVAIMSIPIVGWIAAAIAALIAIGAYFWNTSAKFRAVLKGTWAAFKACFSGIGELAKTTFGAIGDLIKAAFSLDASGIDAALKKLKAGFSDYGKQIGTAFNTAYDAEITESAKKEAAGKSKGKTRSGGTPNSGATVPEVTVPSVNPTGNTLSGASGTGGGSGSDNGGKIRNITVNIDKLVEHFEIHTATVGESTEKVKAVILETLMGALNDTQLAMS
ncbi:phage tail tape measure protein [Sangeribacter muris]|jgi:TP901 family phage tail tape measure protein|uniref:phage tail tape measure protein n=1 Tax=Sangeribacter muris TaxID=2880703 RepID=UPI000FFF32C3|nr:phage tail tape measure protein [Sangeribacter muris]RXE68874.1 phage tail tape measure protein [Muribaculaceae bacterium Isolate-001 (NCI)]